MKKLIVIIIAAFAMGLSHAQTTALNESFESWPAPDWNIYQLGSGGNWLHSSLWGSDLGYNGGHCAKIQISNDPADNWLVSPQISIINNDYELTFYEKSTDIQYYVYAGVYISTGSGNPDDGDFVPVSESLQVNDSWVLHTVDLSSYSGDDIYVAFVYEGTWHHWNVDEVVVSPSSLIDGALTEIINPTGINPLTGIEDIIVNFHNYGTDPISNVDIEWYINGSLQGTHQASGLNLDPGNGTLITIGHYNFSSYGDYEISVNHLLTGDANPSNDTVETIYYVSDPKDAAVTKVLPEGFFPVEGNKDVITTVLNNGNYTIDVIKIEWFVNGVAQTDFELLSVNLEPGAEIDLTIGQHFFITGHTEIECNVIISADEDLTNNSGMSHTAVDIFWESFETSVFPPEMWKADNYPLKDNFWPAPHGGYYYHSDTDDNCFGIINDTLWTPLLNIENGDEISFVVNNSAFFTNNDKLIYKDGSTGNIYDIQTIDSQLEQWDDVIIDISSAAGINYIGFVNDNSGGYGSSHFDMITSDASIYLWDYNLGIRDLQFEELSMIDVPHDFIVTLKNYGTNPVNGNSYSVKIITDSGETLASQSGVALQSWEQTDIILSYTFTETVSKKVQAIIEYSSDQFDENNYSVEYPVYSVPNNVITNDVGFPETENLMIPFNTGGNCMTLGVEDLSQHLYFADELSMEGYLYGITLYYHELFGVGQYVPLQIWLKETELEDLSGGWIDVAEMQTVFNDTIQVYPGTNSVYIPFDEPVLVTGTSNLALQYHQYDPEWPYTAVRFFSTSDPGGPVRAIRLSDYYALDPLNPPAYFGSHTDYTYTSFVFQPIDGEGIISGSVFDENNDTIQWATITVEGTSIVESTGENGIYTLPELPYETYNITASYLAYSDSTISFELNEPNETLDFYLTPLPEVSVFGKVYGSNNPSIPLEDVLVTLTGNEVSVTTTNSNGEFMFETVYGNSDYDIKFELYGYFDLTDSLFIDDYDIDMGDVIMIEEPISAYNVVATPGTSDALITWEDPATSVKAKIQNDTEIDSHSYTNEPYEEVWLGNIFTNTDLVTITSVEVLWDVYELAHDFITVDIIDGTGNILVSSQPVLTYNDSLMTIDVPNISVDGDFYAMVHWKDNPESTDALTIDMSEDVPNTSCIKYPGTAPVMFSEYFGAPPSSFFIRVNVLEANEGKQNREVVSYNLYRGLADDISNAHTWTVLNSEPITELSFIDNTWHNDPNILVYAVEAVYTENSAEFTFSNFISGTTGVEPQTYDEVIIFPNPASSFISISGVNPAHIMIYNIVGEIVYNSNENVVVPEIDVSLFENGTYIIKIRDNQRQIIKKVVINK